MKLTLEKFNYDRRKTIQQHHAPVAKQASRKSGVVPITMLRGEKKTYHVWMCERYENFKNYGNQMVGSDEVE